MKERIRIGTLFSGIGAPEFAASRVYDVEDIFAVEIDKYARESYLANHKVKHMYHDVTKVDFTKHQGEIDVLVGGSPCFVADTKILTLDGYKNIEDVNVGDFVLTHKNRYKKVLKTGHDYKKTVKIKAQGIKETETTLNHPYYISKVNKTWNNNIRKYEKIVSPPEWKNVEDIKKNDFLALPIISVEENPLNLTEDECYVLGRYIADGHTRKDTRKSEGRENDRYWQLILSIGDTKLNDFDNINLHYSKYKHTTSVYRVVFSNKRLVNIAEAYLGIGAKNKVFHPLFLNLPKNLLKIVLDGYLDGDGSNKNGVFSANSISEDLIMSLNLALSKVYNVNSSYMYTKRPKKCIIQGRVVNQNDTFTTTFRKEMKKQSNAIVVKPHVWLPFKNKEETNKTKKVYNLEVQDDNSYTANNAVVHNCQSFSLAGKRGGFEDTRGTLFFHFARAIKESEPQYFIYENVKGMVSHDEGRTLDTVLRTFGELNYKITAKILNTKHYNVPQNRERFFVLGVKMTKEENNLKLQKIKGTNLDARIHNNIVLIQNENKLIPWTEYVWAEPVELTKTLKDVLETCVPKKYYLSDKMMKYLEDKTRAVKPFDGTQEVSPTLCAAYHKTPTDGFYIQKIGAFRGRNPQNPKSRITGDRTEQRLEINNRGTSNTITTVQKDNVVIENVSCKDSFKTKNRIRKLTPRECFRLQDFPENFEFVCSNTQLYRQAGNSMSVNVMEVLFRGIKNHQKGLVSELHKKLQRKDNLDLW